MKKYNTLKFGFFILLSGFLLVQCEEEKPVKLSYKDIYGNEDWPENTGPQVLYIDKSNNVNIVENDNVDDFPSYTITTTGTEPFITTQRLLAVISNPQVITFDYKASDTVNLAISVDLSTNAGYSKIFGLLPANEWTSYSFDVAKLISLNSWGGIGSYFRLYLGEKEGITIDLKNLRFRQRTKEEEQLAKAFFPQWDLSFSNNGVVVEDLTDVFNYVTGYTYKYTVVNDFDPFVHTYPRDRAIAENENYLSFEYKCTSKGSFNVYLMLDYAAGEYTWTDYFDFPPSASMDEWTSITYNLTRYKKLSLKQYPDSMDAGWRMRFDIGTPVGVPLYIRNLRIHE